MREPKQRYCGICNLPLPLHCYSGLRYHPGECREKADAEKIIRCRQKKGISGRARRIEAECPYCGETYSTFAHRPAKTCSDCKCKSQYQRDKLKRMSQGTPKERAYAERYRKQTNKKTRITKANSTRSRLKSRRASAPAAEKRMNIGSSQSGRVGKMRLHGSAVTDTRLA